MSRQNLYVGRAGQMAVMAEFLWRGWNVALPEVDVGEDVFVVKDEDGELSRVQVKTATAQRRREGFSAQFSVSVEQLRLTRTPDLIYIFAVRGSSGWGPFVVIERSVLHSEHLVHGLGSISHGNLIFRLNYEDSKVRCSDRDFGLYLENWSYWPVIAH